MFVTLEEAKGYLRVDSSDEDSFILGLMETANALSNKTDSGST